MKLCSFDIETATVTPDDEDPHKFRPLGICVAATQLVDTELGQLGIYPALSWHRYKDTDSLYPSKLEPVEVQILVDYLYGAWQEGYVPLTWNGLGFDFDIMAEESFDQESAALCANMALHHYDMAFQMLCDKGFMVGMQAAALGLGLHGKSEGMHGDLAPKLWAQSRADQDKVIDYVKQDVQTTSEIALRLMETKALTWTSKSGRPNRWPVAKLLTVSEALQTPEPDTSWMSQPRTRVSCLKWTEKYLKEA